MSERIKLCAESEDKDAVMWDKNNWVMVGDKIDNPLQQGSGIIHCTLFKFLVTFVFKLERRL
jgi:hypothetical protein